MDKILSFLSPAKYYILAIALAAYPAVWLFGDAHGHAAAEASAQKVVIKEDKSIASENKKAADAALEGEQKLSTDIANLENQKNVPLPPASVPCTPSPERVQSLQDLIDQANKP